MSRLAERLVDHAARVMPEPRREWARAMRVELSYIPAPLAAAVFALGCVWASYSQRILQMLIFSRLARWGLAIYALVCAAGYLLATALIGMIKATPTLTPQDLGTDPGTAEALAFHQTYPAWQLAAFAVIAAALVAGAVLLVRRKPAAFPLLASGVAAASLIAVLDRGLVGAADWPLAWSAGWLAPILCLAPAWWLCRRDPDLKSAR